jgi:hypothetical protein
MRPPKRVWLRHDGATITEHNDSAVWGTWEPATFTLGPFASEDQADTVARALNDAFAEGVKRGSYEVSA